MRRPPAATLGFVAALLVVAALAFAVLTAFVRSMIFPASQAPFPEPREGEGWSVARYAAADGARLSGAFFPPPAPGRPVLLYFHGNAEAAAQNLPLADALRAHGFGVLLAEYRGYGGLAGSPGEEGLRADGEAALAELGRRGFPPGPVVLVGRSLGSGVAVDLATRHRVAAVALVSAYTSIVDMGRLVAGPLAPLVVRDRFDSLSKIGRVPAPVVLLHGSLDDVVPVEMGRQLAAARPGARWVEVPGATHNDFPGLAELLAREIDGLLAPPAAAHP
ncbi:MAG: alpha/beta hydrolase [Thermoanaerobaculia bacterium]